MADMIDLSKYLQVFKSNWQVDFEYRLNFFLGRVQNVLILLTLYYLWTTIFQENQVVFGYSPQEIITYVILAHIVRNIVLESNVKFVGEEIINGYLNSVLVKPINYLGQSLSEDVARRGMNIITSIIEVIIFYLIVRPALVFQTNILYLLLFVVSILAAIILHYLISFTAALISFWSEEHFGPSFLMEVLLYMLSGALYPLNALPSVVTSILSVLPFYYLLFFPVIVYLGKMSLFASVSGIFMMVTWIIIMLFVQRFVWQKGLRIYQAYGG